MLSPQPVEDTQAPAVPRTVIEEKISDRGVQEQIEHVFGKGHVMLQVAQCESNLTQYRNGKVLRNANSSAVGVFQIMKSYHYENALDIGHDIMTTKGNIAFAKVLYDQRGLKPWYASKHCWD